MNKSKHTPGPWKILEYDHANRYNRIGPNCDHVVAEVYALPCVGTNSENARLIAGAPDLLLGCKTAIDVIHRSGLGERTDGLDGLCRLLGLAIAKAERGEP